MQLFLGPVRLSALVAAFALFLALAPAAMANHVQCGDTITQDTTLDSDLVCTGDGLIVEGDVELDLAGHTIAGSGGGAGVQAFDRLNLRGGMIRGFANGFFGEPNVVIRNMVFEANRTGVLCHQGAACFVEDSTFRHNGDAIVLDAPDSNPIGAVRGNRVYDNRTGVSIIGYDAPVTDNRILRNEDFGILRYYEGDGDILRNRVANNGGDGVVVTFHAFASIADNVITGNGGVGVKAEFIVTAQVLDNRISDNAGDGVLIGLRVDATIDGNRTDRNGDDGIDVDPCVEDCGFWDVTLRANRAFFNADLGIEAAPFAKDGGGNKAKHNGNTAQCAGVRCK